MSNNKEIPIGLAMSLAMNEFALDFYSGLDDLQRDKITSYVQNGNTGDDAKYRIDNAIENLAHNRLNFLD